jgi:hypothetical protein
MEYVYCRVNLWVDMHLRLHFKLGKFISAHSWKEHHKFRNIANFGYKIS